VAPTDICAQQPRDSESGSDDEDKDGLLDSEVGVPPEVPTAQTLVNIKYMTHMVKPGDSDLERLNTSSIEGSTARSTMRSKVIDDGG
jgi:hypothetical protein